MNLLGFLVFTLVLSLKHWVKQWGEKRASAAAQPHLEHLFPDEKMPPKEKPRSQKEKRDGDRVEETAAGKW